MLTAICMDFGKRKFKQSNMRVKGGNSSDKSELLQKEIHLPVYVNVSPFITGLCTGGICYVPNEAEGTPTNINIISFFHSVSNLIRFFMARQFTLCTIYLFD